MVPCSKTVGMVQKLISEFEKFSLYEKEYLLRIIVNSIVLMSLHELDFSPLYDVLTADVALIRQRESDSTVIPEEIGIVKSYLSTITLLTYNLIKR